MISKEKEYVFIGGRMQGKTRDLINQLISENKELKEEINKISKKELKIMQMLRSIEYCTLTKERIDQIEEVMFELEDNND